MQEVFVKIKEILEKKINPLHNVNWNAAIEEAIEIVDQVAKEFADDTNVGHKNGWIPFEVREADEEDKETYEGVEFMLCGKLPEEDEEILVTYKNGYVDIDTFLREGYECYLDSGCDFVTEAVAWMSKPKGYMVEKND